MFHITEGKGFGLTFANGLTVSVQWGPGNYGDNYDARTDEDYRENMRQAGARGSLTAEVAVIARNRDFLDAPGSDGAGISAYQTPAQVLAILNWAAQQPKGDVT